MIREGPGKILAGDIGGTKTELALLGREGLGLVLTEMRRYANEDYKGIAEVIGEFLKETDTSAADIKATCLGVAGIVEGQGRCCRATNISWTVDADVLEERFSIGEVFLINDLEALGYYVAYGPGNTDDNVEESFYRLQRGAEGAIGNAAVIAAGTGLGESVLHWDGTRHQPSATEGGHTDFAPVGELQEGLLRFLNRKYEHVSYERLLSGMGLENIYDYLSSGGERKESEDVTARMAVEDRASVIGEAGVLGTSTLAAQAVKVFVSIYGAEAGNLALKAGAKGGVYIGGGIAPKILPVIEAGGFMEAFLAKGRMRGLLESVPVYLITDSKAALKGAAAYCRMKLGGE